MSNSPGNSYMINNEELLDVPLHSIVHIEDKVSLNMEPVHSYTPNRGLIRYSAALRHLIPIRKKKKIKDTLNIDKAGFFSLVTFSWLSKYIYKAYKTGLTIDDIPNGSSLDAGQINSERLEFLWQREVTIKGTEASFGKVIWSFCKTRILVSCIVFALSCIMGFLSPIIFMRKLLEYCENEDGETLDGIMWAVCLTFSELSRTFLFTLYWSLSYRTAGRIRSACLCLLYKKTLRLTSLGNKSVGELVNIFANDGQRIFNMVVFGPMIIGGPIVVVCGTFYIYHLLGVWALFGILTFALFYPVQYILSRLTGYYRKRTVGKTDKRINLITEIIKNIKFVKMYAWELYYLTAIRGTRNEECTELRKSLYFQSFTLSLAPTVPVLAAMITFISHVLSGGNLTAAQTFPFLSFATNMMNIFMRTVRDAMVEYYLGLTTLTKFKAFPIVIILTSQMRQALNNVRFSTETIVDGRISYHRIQDILLIEEIAVPLCSQIDKSQVISISNGIFSYKAVQTNVKEADNDEARENTLSGINFCVTKGSLVGVCGAVGSGKSSLLLACLGQMKMTSGKFSRTGSTAYVSQQAWITNATLRENILFGELFESKKYYNVIYICALTEDINLLPGGDETEIGERGVNLSGGQKQRIALARAVYSDRDIYLLDDPLTAVDSHVGQHIFEKCIKGHLCKKTVIFVTNQVQYLQHCDDVYVMKDGQVMENSNHKDLLESCSEYESMLQSTPVDITSQVITPGTKTNYQHSIVTGEAENKGEIQFETYHNYIKSAGGYFLSFFVITIILLNIGCNTFSSWWLAVWISSGSGNTTVIDPYTNESVISDKITDNPDINYYLHVYCSIIGFIIVTSLFRGLIFTQVSVRAATQLHHKLLNKIMSSPMRYFETLPIGRMQNIFSRDFDEVDARLPNSVETLLQNIWTVMFSFLFITIVFPWFVIPLAIFAVLYYFIAKIFRVGIRDLKRLENITRAPILSYLTTTVSGLTTIHAFNKENQFLLKFLKIFDENATIMFMSFNSMRWMAARLDSVSVLIQCITAFMSVLLKSQVVPALAGLALSYAAHISGVFQYTVRLMSETEMRFISVERIQAAAQGLEEESGQGKSNAPPDWPKKGSVRFSNVCLKYHVQSPDVLSRVSFSIKHGEKLGIVGRTGAGKSSIVAALFRLVELSDGKIFIDGLDISTVNLHTLRSGLSVIAQDPVLFSGTFRSNLDPFNDYTDDELWNVLKKTKLLNKVKDLQSEISENGDNISVGERQLLCLARALLRGSKILILDEATAAIDLETESAIQTTLDNEFVNCTVITIAHRLTCVLSCNKVLVLDYGKVLELDNPVKLMANPESVFSKMVAASGIQPLKLD